MKHYPYMVTKDYYFLYNYMFNFDSQFIIALSAEKEDSNHVKIFRMRKNHNGGITIVDGQFYTKHCYKEKEFVEWCKDFKIHGIIPSDAPQR